MKKLSCILVSIVMVTVLNINSNLVFATSNENDVTSSSNKLSLEQMRRNANISKADLQKLLDYQNKISDEVMYEGDKIFARGKADIQKAKENETLKFLYPKAEINNNVKMRSSSSSELGSYGDILVTMNFTSFGSDWGYGHAGIVSNVSGKTVESFPDDGVQYRTNNWKTIPLTYGMWPKGATGENFKNAAYYAARQEGKKYNWNFLNKSTTNEFYCSQLVWRAWKQQNIDVDDVKVDTIVSPAELTKSDNVTCFYYQG